MCSLKNGQKQRVAELRGNQLMPAISRQRDQIAFISDVTGNPDLFVQPFMPEKGAVQKAQQVFSAKQATQGSPSFSPDGKKLAFVSDKDGAPKVYMISIPAPGANIKDIKATLISKANRENSAPSWSPDGKKIAYCSRNKGDRQIWVYDFDKKQETQITEGSGHKENPSWAPNNHHLVYNSSDQKGALYVTTISGGNGVQITSSAVDACFPNWEPR
jgi:TolB protein